VSNEDATMPSPFEDGTDFSTMTDEEIDEAVGAEINSNV